MNGYEKSKPAFRRVTDEWIAALGIRVDRQRLDSTHILSRIDLPSRLGLFCETIRVFLWAAKPIRQLGPMGLCQDLWSHPGRDSAQWRGRCC